MAVAAAVSADYLSTAPFTVSTARTAPQSNGSRVVVIEGSKSLGAAEGCTHTHSGAAARWSADGTFAGLFLGLQRRAYFMRHPRSGGPARPSSPRWSVFVSACLV